MQTTNYPECPFTTELVQNIIESEMHRYASENLLIYGPIIWLSLNLSTENPHTVQHFDHTNSNDPVSCL